MHVIVDVARPMLVGTEAMSLGSATGERISEQTPRIESDFLQMWGT